MKFQLDDKKASRNLNPALELEKGLQLHQQGQFDQAEEIYRQISHLHPLNSDALHLLGVVAMQRGDNPSAVDFILRAVQIQPHHPIYLNNLGNALRQQGRYLDAVGRYQEAIACRPDLAEAYLNMGIAYHCLGKYDQSIAAYHQAHQLKPGSPETCYNMGNVFKEQKYFDEAIGWYQQTVELDPYFADAYYNMASIYEKQGCTEDALACLKMCLQIKPDWAEVHNNLGNMFGKMGQFDEALACYQNAIRLKPDLTEVYNNIGNALKDLGIFTEALCYYEKALCFRPAYPEIYLNMGIAFAEQDRLSEGIKCFQKAIELLPEFAEAYNYMGVALSDRGKRNEAIDCFEKAIELNPDYAETYIYLIHQLQHTCNWSQLEMVSERLDELNRRNAADGRFIPEPPFICMSRQSDLSRNLIISKAWCRKIAQPFQNFKSSFSFESRRQPERQLTIGYLSCDFHDHATAHLMHSLFGLHNRNRFKIYGYSYGPDDNSVYRKKILTQCDRFNDIRAHSQIDAARRIYADGVDILVDLKGHTKGARLGILACRPAPIQVHYLGYPGTTGADFIDYLISDRIVTPEDHAPYYSEQLVFMPHSYQVNDHEQEIASRVWNRKALGLSDKGFVFSSFNFSYKIDPLLFDCWMRIMQQVPNSVLWLFDGGQDASRNLCQEATSRGVDPDRLVFAEKIKKADHLARLKWVDLALDTRIVNGHTTTSDSLWAGVPVITLQGSHFASRVSSSLLNAIDLPELVVHDLAAYERLAVGLAKDPDKLRKIKDKLSKNRLKEPLFDTLRFVRNLEHAYSEMWRIFMEGETSKQFEVQEDWR